MERAYLKGSRDRPTAVCYDVAVKSMRLDDNAGGMTRRLFVTLALFSAIAAVGCKSRSTEAAGVKATKVLVAVDFSKADEQSGTGEMIRAVRAAATKGVRTREIDTRDKDRWEVASHRYKIVVQPTVILLDDADKEVRRLEDESKATVAALNADLQSMTKR